MRFTDEPVVGPKADVALHAGAREVDEERQAGDVARQEVDVLEHAADHARGQQVERPGDGVRERQGAFVAAPPCTIPSRAHARPGSGSETGTTKRISVMRFPPIGSSGCRMLIGIVTRSASTGAPRGRDIGGSPPVTAAMNASLTVPPPAAAAARVRSSRLNSSISRSSTEAPCLA